MHIWSMFRNRLIILFLSLWKAMLTIPIPMPMVRDDSLSLCLMLVNGGKWRRKPTSTIVSTRIMIPIIIGMRMNMRGLKNVILSLGRTGMEISSKLSVQRKNWRIVTALPMARWLSSLERTRLVRKPLIIPTISQVGLLRSVLLQAM